MNRLAQTVLLSGLLTATLLRAQPAAPKSLPPEVQAELCRRIVHLVRWAHFWEDRYTSYNYPQRYPAIGQELDVRVLVFSDRVQLFVPDLLLNPTFPLENGKLGPPPVSCRSYTVGQTSEEAEKEYLEIYTRQPGPRLVIENGLIRKELSRPPAQPEEFERYQFALPTPPLAPPDYIVNHTLPADLYELKRAIGRRLRREAELFGDQEVVIPYYGPDDPSVHVLVRGGDESGETEFYQRGHRIWEWGGEIWPQIGRDSHMGKQILKHRLCEITIRRDGSVEGL